MRWNLPTGHIMPEPSRNAVKPPHANLSGEKILRATRTLQFLKVSRLNLAEGRTEFLLLNGAFGALLASLYFARAI